MTEQQPTPRRIGRVAAIIAAVVVLAAAAVYWTVIRDQSFTVTGSIILIDTDGNGLTSAGDNTKCRGRGGYSDLTETTQVIVTDATGTIVATGAVDGFGTAITDGGRLVRCDFTFTVRDVPAGHDFYGVEVARRGKVTFPAEKLRAPLALEIGS